jgi:metallophosphoesterase (TIGR00282 family)
VAEIVKILFIGDIIGRPGRNIVKKILPALKNEYDLDFIIANGENSAGGFGLTRDVLLELFDMGINVLTSGNHIWDKKDIYNFIDNENRLLRPLNYPPKTPGRGAGSYLTQYGKSVTVINVMGRIFNLPIDCPFRGMDKELEKYNKNSIIIVDIHAEATSEKVAMGYYLDGRVTAVLGTHTHIQTADDRILAGGTAYITDVGMTGARDSVIGMRKDQAMRRFLLQLPVRFNPAIEMPYFNGIVIKADAESGKAEQILRLNMSVE